MGYYQEKLAGLRLQKCYDLANARIKQYLQAEIKHILSRITTRDSVLELGCGYGRVMEEIAKKADRVTGIDSALENIEHVLTLFSGLKNCQFLLMDAVKMTFAKNTFDVVACIQNGICAFNVDQFTLLSEALRVTKPGGRIIFSSYSDKIWSERLKWFETQAEHGLVGEIDYRASGDGVIVCQDGFSSGTMSQKDFCDLGFRLGLKPGIQEVDGSSLFCEFVKPVNFKSLLRADTLP